MRSRITSEKDKETTKSTSLSYEQAPFDEGASTGATEGVSAASPMLINGDVVSSPNHQIDVNNEPSDLMENNSTYRSETASVVSDEYEDPFGDILHPTTIDEDTDDEELQHHTDTLTTNRVTMEDSGTESDGDDFENLLRYQDSDDESSIQPSIATVLQEKNPIFQASRRQSVASMYSATSGGSQFSGVSTILQSRRLVDGDNYSELSAASSMGDTASVPTVLRNRQSETSVNSIPSAVGRMKQAAALPFRDTAPVKPTEQTHRVLPGSNCLSSMQKNPMQARTWRALAAAAQEKDIRRDGSSKTIGTNRRRGSLSERNPNIHGQ
jgi:hypothetical protein